MDAGYHPYADTGEGTVSRSWRLTRTAWDLIRGDRAMLAIAVLQLVFGMAISALILYLGGYFEDPTQPAGRLALLGLIGLYPSTFISVFFGVALASAAQAAMEGRHLSLQEALGAAVRRLDSIALWALLAAGVGALINEIASRIPGGGRIVAWLLDVAWSLATILVVPVLALEGTGPIRSLRRSAQLLKRSWGEGIAGSLTIAMWTLVVSLPAVVLLVAGGAASNSNHEEGLALILVGLFLIFVVGTLAAAVRQVFAVALYRFAADGRADVFPRADLESPFTAKRRWFGGGKSHSRSTSPSD